MVCVCARVCENQGLSLQCLKILEGAAAEYEHFSTQAASAVPENGYTVAVVCPNGASALGTADVSVWPWLRYATSRRISSRACACMRM